MFYQNVREGICLGLFLVPVGRPTFVPLKLSEEAGEVLLTDSVERTQLAELLAMPRGVERLGPASRGDQQIFARVLWRDELEHIGPVSLHFQ